jgi:tetratricopeptide (TPR) repeat protein
MSSCIVCHKPQDSKPFIECPNGHPVHRDPCLKQWFVTGKEPICPFCREPYNMNLQKFFDECQKERLMAEQKALSMKIAARVDPAAREKVEIVQRAQNLINQKKFDPALNLLFDTQKKHPDDPEIAFQLGNIFFLQQKYGLAVNHLMKTVKIDFKQPTAFYLLARCFLSLEMPDKAAWAAERALVYLGPENVEYREFCKNITNQRLNPAPPRP